MSGRYILGGADGHTPILTDDLMEWAQWFETAERHVNDTTIGDVRVSTVFLGLDHNFSGEGEPVLFETMIFGGPMTEEQMRYSTWEQAALGHAAHCDVIRAGAST